MDKERLFRTGFAIFWLVALGLLVLDTASSSNIRVEPPPIALGSGQAASGALFGALGVRGEALGASI